MRHDDKEDDDNSLTRPLIFYALMLVYIIVLFCWTYRLYKSESETDYLSEYVQTQMRVVEEETQTILNRLQSEVKTLQSVMNSLQSDMNIVLSCKHD